MAVHPPLVSNRQHNALLPSWRRGWRGKAKAITALHRTKMCSSLLFALKSISFWFSLSSKQNAKSLLSESSTAQYTTLKEITTTDLNRTDRANWFRLMLFALHLLQKEVCLWPTALTQLTQLHSCVPEVPMLLVTRTYFLELPCIFCKLEACLHIYWSTQKKGAILL